MPAVKTRSSRRRRPVTSAEVVAAAVEIVDREGVEGLTIRRVAEACRLSPMGIYRHVQDKDDLLDRVVDTVVGPSLEGLEAAGAWDQQVAQLFRHARALFLQHPGVAVLCVLRPTPVVGVARFYDRVLAALAEGGLDARSAVHAFDTLLMFMFGSVLWEIPRAPDVRGRLVTVALDDHTASHVIARATELSHRDPTEYFEAGLRAIMNGLGPDLSTTTSEGPSRPSNPRRK